MLKNNVGSVDRAIRFIGGVALLAAFFMYQDASWRYWTLLGIIPLATALMGTCPLYSILGMSTCPAKRV